MKRHDRPRRWNASPAACLIPQLRANRLNARGRRGKKFYESDSPGKLFTYVSAGNIETPSVVDAREPCVRRGATPVVVMAVVLVIIWFVF